jgi:hypothetical protein
MRDYEEKLMKRNVEQAREGSHMTGKAGRDALDYRYLMVRRVVTFYYSM